MLFSRLALAMFCVGAASAAAQSTQPVWYPPMSLYGRPVSRPYFDFPNWARYTYCRPAPLTWGYDPFPNYGPCDGGGMEFAPGTVNCPGDFVAHRPSAWYGSFDFAPLTFDHLDGFAVARIGPVGGEPVGMTVLTTEDLMQEFAAGGKYTVGRRIFDCYRIEASYLGFHRWDDERFVTNTATNSEGSAGNLSTFLSGFSDPITVGLDAADFVSISLQSDFQSAEINGRYWVEMPPGPLDVSLLVGVRYLRLAERFTFFSQSAEPAPGGATNDLIAEATNDLWGAQIGIEGAWLLWTRFWVDFDLKGGIYNDRIEINNSLIQNGAATVVADTRDRTAWVGDISLVANWQMTPWISLRAGYQAIFINGVALAQDQARTFIVNTPGSLNDKGEIAIHGPILGLSAMW